MHGNFQRVAVDDGDGVVGIQQIAESGRAARFGQAALDAVAGHAQRQGADFGLIVADAPAVPLDDELGVGRAEPEQAHPAAVGCDLDGGGAAGKADGLGLFISDIVGVALFHEAAVGHQFDAVILVHPDGLGVLELLRAALDADDEIFLHVRLSFALVFVDGDLLHRPSLVLAEEEVCRLRKTVRRVADVEMCLPGGVVGPQTALAEGAFQMVGGGLGRVHQHDVPAHEFADHGLDEGIVGAAQNEGVHPGIPHLGQVLGDDEPGHFLLVFGAVVHVTGLHQRHEERAGAGCDLHARHQFAQQGLIAAGADGGRGANDADAAVAGGKRSLPRSRIHDAQVGHGQQRRLGGGVGAGHRAAGGHDALDILGQQERDVLPGILQDGLRAAAAVGHTAGVAEVDDILVGEPLAQLLHAGQAAEAAVKYADGAVIHAAFPSFPAPVRSDGRSGRAQGCPRAP